MNKSLQCVQFQYTVITIRLGNKGVVRRFMVEIGEA